MKLSQTLFFVLATAAGLTALPACDSNAAEKTGEAVDEAVDDVEDAAEEVADEVEDAVDGH
jgi:hypothetical protein